MQVMVYKKEDQPVTKNEGTKTVPPVSSLVLLFPPMPSLCTPFFPPFPSWMPRGKVADEVPFVAGPAHEKNIFLSTNNFFSIYVLYIFNCSS